MILPRLYHSIHYQPVRLASYNYQQIRANYLEFRNSGTPGTPGTPETNPKKETPSNSVEYKIYKKVLKVEVF